MNNDRIQVFVEKILIFLANLPPTAITEGQLLVNFMFTHSPRPLRQMQISSHILVKINLQFLISEHFFMKTLKVKYCFNFFYFYII